MSNKSNSTSYDQLQQRYELNGVRGDRRQVIFRGVNTLGAAGYFMYPDFETVEAPEQFKQEPLNQLKLDNLLDTPTLTPTQQEPLELNQQQTALEVSRKAVEDAHEPVIPS